MFLICRILAFIPDMLLSMMSVTIFLDALPKRPHTYSDFDEVLKWHDDTLRRAALSWYTPWHALVRLLGRWCAVQRCGWGIGSCCAVFVIFT